MFKTRMETVTCSRCMGAGRYSYNMRDGDRCYGCGGKGVKYTKRASVALGLFIELRAQPLDSFTEGDLVRYRPAMQAERTVQLARQIHESNSGSYGKNADGTTNYDEVIKHKAVTFSWGKPENRKGTSYNFPPSHAPMLGAVVSDELHERAVDLIVEYQYLLTKQGTVRKDSIDRESAIKAEISEIFSSPENRINKPVVLPKG